MQETLLELNFPLAGINVSTTFTDQDAAQLLTGDYAKSTRFGKNVRGYDPVADRARGGSRNGIVRYIAQPVVAGWLIQELALLVGVGYSPPGGSMQASQSGRVVTLVAVSQGNVYTAPSGGTSWTVATNGTPSTPPLNFSGLVFSTSLNQKLWFADGSHWAYYDPSTNTVSTWAATAGSLPVDSIGNLPRLICTWRGRMVLSGLINDPQNWFMSRVSTPTDFDYFPSFQSADQAVAGNNSPLGLIGDVITGMLPYTDDILLMFGDHTIYKFQGDPMSGGNIHLVTNAIGGAWGMPFCMDPFGKVYFLSNRMGIYSLDPMGGGPPVRISQQIDQLLQAYNSGQMTFRMIWNDAQQGFHLFASYTLQPAISTHFFYDSRAGAWWMDQFANTNHNPLCCCVFDGNTPGDRAALITSWDGYVRSLSSPTQTTDDTVAIASDVVIGPLKTKDLDELIAKDLQAVLGESSSSVTYAVYIGTSAEKALNTTPVCTGTWAAGRNLSNLVRRAGHALYVRITSSNPWAMEQIRIRIADQGKVRRRGY